MYNSREYRVPAKKSVHLEKHCAEHGVHRCVFRLDPITGAYNHKLGIRITDEKGEISELFDCSPIDYVPGEDEELLDREAMGEAGKVKTIKFRNTEAPKEPHKEQKELEWA